MDIKHLFEIELKNGLIKKETTEKVKEKTEKDEKKKLDLVQKNKLEAELKMKKEAEAEKNRKLEDKQRKQAERKKFLEVINLLFLIKFLNEFICLIFLNEIIRLKIIFFTYITGPTKNERKYGKRSTTSERSKG